MGTIEALLQSLTVPLSPIFNTEGSTTTTSYFPSEPPHPRLLPLRAVDVPEFLPALVSAYDEMTASLPIDTKVKDCSIIKNNIDTFIEWISDKRVGQHEANYRTNIVMLMKACAEVARAVRPGVKELQHNRLEVIQEVGSSRINMDVIYRVDGRKFFVVEVKTYPVFSGTSSKEGKGITMQRELFAEDGSGLEGVNLASEEAGGFKSTLLELGHSMNTPSDLPAFDGMITDLNQFASVRLHYLPQPTSDLHRTELHVSPVSTCFGSKSVFMKLLLLPLLNLPSKTGIPLVYKVPPAPKVLVADDPKSRNVEGVLGIARKGKGAEKGRGKEAEKLRREAGEVKQDTKALRNLRSGAGSANSDGGGGQGKIPFEIIDIIKLRYCLPTTDHTRTFSFLRVPPPHPLTPPPSASSSPTKTPSQSIELQLIQRMVGGTSNAYRCVVPKGDEVMEGDIVAKIAHHRFEHVLRREATLYQTHLMGVVGVPIYYGLWEERDRVMIVLSDCGEKLVEGFGKLNATQRASALSIVKSIHAAGIYHGDLTEDNFAIKDGVIRVIDFSHSHYHVCTGKCDELRDWERRVANDRS